MTTILLLALLALQSAAGVMDLTAGPVATTTVAARIGVDAEGRVTSCTPGALGPVACGPFTRGKVVALPLRRGGRPVAGLMTISTTTVVSAQ